VDIGGTDIKLGIVTEAGEIRESGKIPTEPAAGPEAAASRVRRWLAGVASGAGRVVAAGVDCAGLIDGERGFLHASPNMPGWKDVPLASIFAGELACPVVVENDANAAAYGEWARGAGRGMRDFVCLTLGTGVGGGIVVNGGLYRGASGFAGEIGHTVIVVDGPPCACGKRGCLEAFIGARAIVERALGMLHAAGGTRPGWGPGLTVEEISGAASSGDAVAVAALAETGRYLGVALANVVHVLAPEAIAIGGGVSGAGDFILAPARATLRDSVLDQAMASVRIVPAELGNRASFIGVSLLAFLRVNARR
ncbi:MAG TPA: ROK family protein, partial [Candidatus Bathyarchaeia archaeon]|nr:ROK family protein [Candidatus Bathyarchaeia archaeon]